MVKIDVNNPPEDQRGTCPRCKKERLWVGDRVALNALSRRDNKTYICSPCGTDEAMIDYAQTLDKSVPWWNMTAETHTVTERSTAMLKAMEELE